MPRVTKKTSVRATRMDPMTDLVTRLETTLSAGITRLSVSISELAVSVATHKERLDNVDRRSNSHSNDIQRLEQSQTQIHDRIHTVQTDLSDKMIAQTESLKQHVNSSVAEIAELVKDADKKREEGDAAILARVAKLEIWRWMIVGGAAVGAVIVSGVIWKIVSAVIDKVDWFSFFSFAP